MCYCSLAIICISWDFAVKEDLPGTPAVENILTTGLPNYNYSGKRCTNVVAQMLQLHMK